MHRYGISGLIRITNDYLFVVADTDAITDNINLTNAKTGMIINMFLD